MTAPARYTSGQRRLLAALRRASENGPWTANPNAPHWMYQRERPNPNGHGEPITYIVVLSVLIMDDGWTSMSILATLPGQPSIQRQYCTYRQMHAALADPDSLMSA